MGKLFAFLLLALGLGCNDSASDPRPGDQDHTINKDTSNRIMDSVSTVDSLKGR